MNKKVQYKQKTALLLACLSLLVFGGVALYVNGGITYTSIIASCPTVIPAVSVMYCLGWLIGLVTEGSKSLKNTPNIGYTNNLLEEILKEESLNTDDSSVPDLGTEAELENSFISGIEPESKE